MNDHQLSTPLSIETIQEIVRSYYRNERYIEELIHYMRDERKKAEHLLHEVYKRLNETSTSKEIYSKPTDCLSPFDDDNQRNQIETRSSLKKQSNLNQLISTNINHVHRVRFNIPEKTYCTKNDESLKRSTKFRSSLHIRHEYDHSSIFHPTSYQHTVELDHRYHQTNSPNVSLHNPSSESDVTMKQFLDHKYEQQYNTIKEIQQRNYLRTKILQARLRQHALMHKTCL